MAQHDYVLDNAPGAPFRADINAALAAIATLNAGTTEPSLIYAGMLWLDLSVPPNGLLRQRNQANSAWVALQFGSLNADGSLQVGTMVLRPATAQAFNRIVNPAMQHSQEQGDTASAASATVTWFPADQWQVNWVLNSGAANVSRTRAPAIGNDAIAIGINTVAAAPDYMQVHQQVEGLRVKDFLWGTAAARQVVFRFNFSSSVLGTFSVMLKNGAGDRTFLAPFTVTTVNQWKVYSVVIPGDTAGTWPTTSAHGLSIGIGLAAGSTLAGGVAGWQAGNKVQMAGHTNAAGVAGSYYFADAGLYLDPDVTGLPPPFIVPDYTTELDVCKRYWRWSPVLHGRTGSTVQSAVAGDVQPAMRVAAASAIAPGAVVNIPYVGNPALTGINMGLNDLPSGIYSGLLDHAATTANVWATVPAGQLKLNARM